MTDMPTLATLRAKAPVNRMPDTYGNPMTLLEICAAVHDHNTGASDPLSVDEVRELRAYLQDRLDAWHDGVAPWKAYDDAVKSLVVATLAEESWGR